MTRDGAVIVGASGAIGRPLARTLAARHWQVGLLARTEDRLDATSQAIARAGGNVFVECVDVTNAESVVNAARKLRERPLSVRSLIYAVGRAPDVEVPLQRYPLSEWSETMEVYCGGFLRCFQAFLPSLERGGHIVVLSSAITRFSTTTLPPFHAGHYAAAKAALDAMCIWARREAHEREVLLSRVAPSAVDTAAHRAAPPLRRPTKVVRMERLCTVIADALDQHEEVDEVMLGDTALSPSSGM